METSQACPSSSERHVRPKTPALSQAFMEISQACPSSSERHVRPKTPTPRLLSYQWIQKSLLSLPRTPSSITTARSLTQPVELFSTATMREPAETVSTVTTSEPAQPISTIKQSELAESVPTAISTTIAIESVPTAISTTTAIESISTAIRLEPAESVSMITTPESAESVPSIISSKPIESISTVTTSEPAESVSNSTSATTATGPSSEQIIHTTSAQPTLEIFPIHNIYVSPAMPVPGELPRIWTFHVKNRLSRILDQKIPVGTYVLEFMMAGKGKRRENMKPTLIITCGDEKTKRLVDKTIKGETWLQVLLKVHNIEFVPLVEATVLSAGSATNEGRTVKLSKSYAVQLLPSTTTSCGLAVRINHAESPVQQHCTLGGLIIVDNKILGLTAGHPFQKFMSSFPRQANLMSLSDEKGKKPSKPFGFDGIDKGGGKDDPPASTVSADENANVNSTSIDGPHRQPQTLTSFSPSMKWYPSPAVTLPVSRHVMSCEDSLYDHDWALLEKLPSIVKSKPNKPDDISIEATVPDPARGEVTIAVADIGPQPGYLYSSSSTIKVDRVLLNVQLITLKQVLPLGSSGAWVILGGMLCGYIVATRLHTPWAYMVAIEPIFADIKRKLEANVVRLPRADELGSLNLSPKPPLTISSEYDLPHPSIPAMDVGNVSQGHDATSSSSCVSPVSQSRYVSDGFQSPDQTAKKITVPSNSRWSSQDLNPISQLTTNRRRLDDQVVLRGASNHQSNSSITMAPSVETEAEDRYAISSLGVGLGAYFSRFSSTEVNGQGSSPSTTCS